jgi:hypothetical protein
LYRKLKIKIRFLINIKFNVEIAPFTFFEKCFLHDEIKSQGRPMVGFAKMPEFFMPAPTAPIPATAGSAGSAGTRKKNSVSK